MELDELHMTSEAEYEWREKARWIKFEEDVEEGAERWGKPHVASLSFHSLLELRRGLESGTLMPSLLPIVHVIWSLQLKLLIDRRQRSVGSRQVA